MLNETAPVYLLGKCGPIVQVMNSLGYLIVFTSGLGLPQLDYNPELRHDIDNTPNKIAFDANYGDNFWRVIFIVPLFVNVFMIVSFMVFI